MIVQVPGPGNELVLSSTPADGVTPDAVLGVCPVNAQSPCAFGSPSRQSHYWSTTMDDGTKLEWEQLLFDSTLHQYENMCECLHSRVQFHLSCCKHVRCHPIVVATTNGPGL